MMQIGMPKEGVVMDLPHVRPKPSSARFEHHLQEDHAPRADTSSERATDASYATNPNPAGSEATSATVSAGVGIPTVQAMLLKANGARLFAQSLHVVGYLSMAGIEGEGDDKGASEPAAAIDDGQASQTFANAAIAHGEREQAIGAGALSGSDVGAAVVVMQHAGDDAESAVTPSSSQAVLAADQPWARRLVRLSQKGDGATLWVRDFRLAPSSAPEAAAALLKDLQTGCSSIHTVMVNGRTAWQSNHALHNLPPGNTP